MDPVKWKNRKVLVSGGKGYLGSHLLRTLENRGANVYVMDLDAEETDNSFRVDVTDREHVKKVVQTIQPDIIYHLAASLDRRREFTNHDRIMRINYYGTFHLLEALKEIPYQNFVFTSTSEVYGANVPPFHEQQIPDPASPYSLSKLFAEQLIQTYSKTNNKPYTILRVFNFFGPGMPEKFFIPELIRSLREESVFKMTEGEQARDFLYVDDVIRALSLAVEKEEAVNQILNVCSGKSITLKNLVIAFQKEINSDCRIDFGALPYRENEVWNMVGNNEKINRMLGFTPAFDLSQSIRKTLNTKN